MPTCPSSRNSRSLFPVTTSGSHHKALLTLSLKKWVLEAELSEAEVSLTVPTLTRTHTLRRGAICGDQEVAANLPKIDITQSHRTNEHVGALFSDLNGDTTHKTNTCTTSQKSLHGLGNHILYRRTL